MDNEPPQAPTAIELVYFNWGYLYRSLRQRVADQVYRTRQLVTGLQVHAKGPVGLVLADGRREDFDLVLCADGYRSGAAPGHGGQCCRAPRTGTWPGRTGT